MGVWAIIEIVGGVLGSLLTIITFIGVISKKPREMFRKAIRDESANANQLLIEKLDKIEKRMDAAETTDLVMLRNCITALYFKYREKQEIPHYAKENWLYLYKEYKDKGGNSYVASITKDMQDLWKEI